MLASLTVWTTAFQTLLESEPAGPLLSGNIHEGSNKSVIQAGRTAVCSYMQRRVEVNNSPDWQDVDVAMTNSWCCTDSFQGRAVYVFFSMLKLLNKTE